MAACSSGRGGHTAPSATASTISGWYHDAGEALAILRAPFRSLQQQHKRFRPEFCKYNSGSPRCNNGNRSPRGADTFLPERAFAGAPSDVVEVTFRDSVELPPDTEVAGSLTGSWAPLVPRQHVR